MYREILSNLKFVDSQKYKTEEVQVLEGIKSTIIASQIK